MGHHLEFVKYPPRLLHLREHVPVPLRVHQEQDQHHQHAQRGQGRRAARVPQRQLSRVSHD
jgi:hypothetical protein